MKKIIVSLALCSTLVAGYAAAAEKTAQQQKMTVCNQQASSQTLKGDARKSFMSSCLKKGAKTSGLTAQQQKMKTCNATAKSQKLAGAERKTFMSQCLKKS